MKNHLIAAALFSTFATGVFAEDPPKAKMPTAETPAQTGSITVRVTGLKPEEAEDGTFLVAIHDDAARWPKLEDALQVKKVPAQEVVGQSALEVTFDDIPLNHAYAMQALHDENGNGELDFRWKIFPKEGFGLSNDYQPREQPKFEKAAIEFSESPLTTNIELAY